MTSRYPRTLAALAAAVVLAAAGCGGDDGEAENASTGENASANADVGIAESESKDKRERAIEQGKAAAEQAGEPVELEPKTIGVIQITGAAEIMQRQLEAVRAGARTLGWNVKVCDGRGEPARFAECARSMLAQNVDAIIGENIEPAPVQAQLKEAQQRGIPWINTGGPVAESPLITASVHEDEAALGSAPAEYLVEQLGGEGTVAFTVSPASYALKLRGDAGKAVLDAQPGIEIVNEHEVDLANLVEDVRGWSSTVLTKDKDLDAFLFTVVTDVLAVAPVVRSRYGDVQPPERPWIVGNGGDRANLDLVRKGQIDAVADVALEATSYMALDQLAEHFARDAEIVKEPAGEYPDFLRPTVITKENVPEDPQAYVEPEDDFVSFFEAKWEAEFGGG